MPVGVRLRLIESDENSKTCQQDEIPPWLAGFSELPRRRVKPMDVGHGHEGLLQPSAMVDSCRVSRFNDSLPSGTRSRKMSDSHKDSSAVGNHCPCFWPPSMGRRIVRGWYVDCRIGRSGPTIDLSKSLHAAKTNQIHLLHQHVCWRLARWLSSHERTQICRIHLLQQPMALLCLSTQVLDQCCGYPDRWPNAISTFSTRLLLHQIDTLSRQDKLCAVFGTWSRQ